MYTILPLSTGHRNAIVCQTSKLISTRVNTDKQHDQVQQPQTRRQEQNTKQVSLGDRHNLAGAGRCACQEAHEGRLILFDTHLGSSTAANEQHLLLRPNHFISFTISLLIQLKASVPLALLLVRHKNLKCASHVTHCNCSHTNIIEVRQLAWQAKTLCQL